MFNHETVSMAKEEITTPEDLVLTLFKQGREEAFESIFHANYDRIMGFCVQFIGDKDQAQNITQEAFLKLWLNREKIEIYNGIRSFLYTSAKTDCLNFIRHKKVIYNYENKQLQYKEDQLNVEVLESFDDDGFFELENLIDQLIDKLPDKCRDVFIKSRFEGKKNKEIAEEMDISVKAVEANMTRALRILKSELTDYMPLLLVQLIFYAN